MPQYLLIELLGSFWEGADALDILESTEFLDNADFIAEMDPESFNLSEITSLAEGEFVEFSSDLIDSPDFGDGVFNANSAVDIDMAMDTGELNDDTIGEYAQEENVIEHNLRTETPIDGSVSGFEVSAKRNPCILHLTI